MTAAIETGAMAQAWRAWRTRRTKQAQAKVGTTRKIQFTRERFCRVTLLQALN